MKRAVFLVACFLVLTSGSSIAAEDPFCDQLNKILAGAGSGFAGLKGEMKKGETEEWTANASIRGGRECFVVGKDAPAYMCSLYAGDADDKARLTYEDHVEWIGKCLGSEWKGRETADAKVTEHTFSRGATDPKIRVRSVIGDGNAYAVEIWVDPAS